jgi:hypothetical protein
MLNVSVFAQQQSPQPAAAVAAAPAAPATTQPMLSHINKELPAWLRFSGEYRMRLEGFDGGGFKPDTSDAYLLSRVRINMRVSPTYWMRFQFQGQDAQVFWKNTEARRAAFRKHDGHPAGLRRIWKRRKRPQVLLKVVGQEMFFGDQRLIGHLELDNTARSFDACATHVAAHQVQSGSVCIVRREP